MMRKFIRYQRDGWLALGALVALRASRVCIAFGAHRAAARCLSGAMRCIEAVDDPTV